MSAIGIFQQFRLGWGVCFRANGSLIGGANDGGSVLVVAHTLAGGFDDKPLFRLTGLSLLPSWLRFNHGVSKSPRTAGQNAGLESSPQANRIEEGRLTAYKDLLTLWKDADPDIPILKEAKAEYAKLQ
jgi:hypothetical protein